MENIQETIQGDFLKVNTWARFGSTHLLHLKDHIYTKLFRFDKSLGITG